MSCWIGDSRLSSLRGRLGFFYLSNSLWGVIQPNSEIYFHWLVNNDGAVKELSSFSLASIHNGLRVIFALHDCLRFTLSITFNWVLWNISDGYCVRFACRLLFCKKFKHLVVKTDVIAFHVGVGLVSLQVDAEAGELLKSLCLPAFLLNTFLYWISKVIHENEMIWIHWVLSCLISIMNYWIRLHWVLSQKIQATILLSLVAANSIYFNRCRSRSIFFLCCLDQLTRIIQR